jgi:hypothetical protein
MLLSAFKVGPRLPHPPAITTGAYYDHSEMCTVPNSVDAIELHNLRISTEDSLAATANPALWADLSGGREGCEPLPGVTQCSSNLGSDAGWLLPFSRNLRALQEPFSGGDAVLELYPVIGLQRVHNPARENRCTSRAASAHRNRFPHQPFEAGWRDRRDHLSLPIVCQMMVRFLCGGNQKVLFSSRWLDCGLRLLHQC